MTMAALRAVGSRADPSPYALTSLASSEVNQLPAALPEGMRTRLCRQSTTSA